MPYYYGLTINHIFSLCVGKHKSGFDRDSIMAKTVWHKELLCCCLVFVVQRGCLLQ